MADGFDDAVLNWPRALITTDTRPSMDGVIRNSVITCPHCGFAQPEPSSVRERKPGAPIDRAWNCNFRASDQRPYVSCAFAPTARFENFGRPDPRLVLDFLKKPDTHSRLLLAQSASGTGPIEGMGVETTTFKSALKKCEARDAKQLCIEFFMRSTCVGCVSLIFQPIP